MIKSSIIIFFMTISLYAGEIDWIHRKGDVQVNHSPVVKTLQFNDVITTGKNSLAIIKINQKTTVKLNENSSLQILKPKRKIFDSDLWLEAGSVVTDYLNDDKKKTMRIKTKHAIMGVRGTRFFVTYGLSDDTWMCVNEGQVIVKNSEVKKLVNAGEGIHIGKEMGEARKLLWTRKLNWNLNPSEELVNNLKLEDAYQDVLNFDYD